MIKKIAFAVIGCLAGAALAFLVILLILITLSAIFGRNFAPFGLGWGMFVLSGAIGGWGFGWSMAEFITVDLFREFLGSSRKGIFTTKYNRATFALTPIWAILLWVHFEEEVVGWRWDTDEVVQFCGGVLMFPIALFAARHVWNWVNRAPN